MLESVVSNKVNNISTVLTKNFNTGGWFESDNLKSNRLDRKRYYPSNFEQDYHSNQGSDKIWKRRKEYTKQCDFTWAKNKNLRKSQSDANRKHKTIARMTRTSCCQLRRQNGHIFTNNIREPAVSGYQRNRSLSQSNEGRCLNHNQLPIMEDNSGQRRNPTTNLRNLHPGLLHQISSRSSNQMIQGKDSLNISNSINNCCNIQLPQMVQSASQCGLINQFPVAPNSVTFRQHNQATRRRHNTIDLTPSYQSGLTRSAHYAQSRPINISTSQASNRVPCRSLSSHSTSFPLDNRTFCQNQNQLGFVTYPMSQYSQQQQTVFSRGSVSTTTILPHNSAFSPTVQMPTVIGDVISSTPCHQCAIMAGSGLSTFSNLSSMFPFPVAPTATSLVTLAAVSGDRIHGSRLNFLPVHPINNWHNQNPYLPAAWSYNDLSSILHNSTARHILRDNLTQRLLSNSTNIGIQFVMITPSSVLRSGDASQIRHMIPVSRSDPLSPIAVSRYLPIIDHFPLIDQPKPGITKQELDQIPIKRFVKLECTDMTATEEDKERCMICLEDFLSNEVIRLLKCSHDFHSLCVERWLKINRTCPLCRSDVVETPTGSS